MSINKHSGHAMVGSSITGDNVPLHIELRNKRVNTITWPHHYLTWMIWSTEFYVVETVRDFVATGNIN